MNIINAVKFQYLRTPLSLLNKSSTKLWIKHQSTDNNTPIKYTGSKAAGWKAEYTRRGAPREDETPWFQTYVVSASVGAFLLYFCVLREENDIDEKLNISLYDRIEGLEKTQLKTSLEYYQERGLDTKKIRERLEELESDD